RRDRRRPSARMLVTNTSQLAAIRSRAARPSSCLKSSVTFRLLRSRFSATPDSCGCGPLPITRLLSPAGFSTVMTSAPRSPRICVANGPMTTAVRSSTRMPLSGPPLVSVSFINTLHRCRGAPRRSAAPGDQAQGRQQLRHDRVGHVPVRPLRDVLSALGVVVVVAASFERAAPLSVGVLDPLVVTSRRTAPGLYQRAGGTRHPAGHADHELRLPLQLSADRPAA